MQLLGWQLVEKGFWLLYDLFAYYFLLVPRALHHFSIQCTDKGQEAWNSCPEFGICESILVAIFVLYTKHGNVYGRPLGAKSNNLHVSTYCPKLGSKGIDPLNLGICECLLRSFRKAFFCIVLTLGGALNRIFMILVIGMCIQNSCIARRITWSSRRTAHSTVKYLYLGYLGVC